MSNLPIEARWKPGQSGNPNGRPKGRKNTKTIINKFLNSEAPQYIQDKFGKFTKDTKIDELMIANLIIRTLGGDMRAGRIFYQLAGDMENDHPIEHKQILNIFNTLPAEVQENIKQTYNNNSGIIDVSSK